MRLGVATLVVAAAASWLWHREADLTAQPKVSVDAGSRRNSPFDFYLLAMTLHPAFCADGHGRKAECRGDPRPLSIHGLWPERREPGQYPRDCPGPPLDLADELAAELRPLMPGMTEDLHGHEWRRHGTCSGLGDDEYFVHTLRLARGLEGALRGYLTTVAGGATSAAELRAQADRAQPGLGASLTFHCRPLREAPPARRGQAFLVEIRQCVDDDGAFGAPGSLLDCAAVGRRDQGCGRTFQVAELRP